MYDIFDDTTHQRTRARATAVSVMIHLIDILVAHIQHSVLFTNILCMIRHC